jgi:hypothetical protein
MWNGRKERERGREKEMESLRLVDGDIKSKNRGAERARKKSRATKVADHDDRPKDNLREINGNYAHSQSVALAFTLTDFVGGGGWTTWRGSGLPRSFFG